MYELSILFVYFSYLPSCSSFMSSFFLSVRDREDRVPPCECVWYITRQYNVQSVSWYTTQDSVMHEVSVLIPTQDSVTHEVSVIIIIIHWTASIVVSIILPPLCPDTQHKTVLVTHEVSVLIPTQDSVTHEVRYRFRWASEASKPWTLYLHPWANLAQRS